jgi:AcrR family transcriptional regulator
MNTNQPVMPEAKRAYRQGARARNAEQTAERIVAAFARRMEADWFDQITLEQIARDAGVTVPTIIRRFGSKEGLLKPTWAQMEIDILKRRQLPVGDPVKAVRALVDDYEEIGDFIIRALAQEERYPLFKPLNDIGRVHHRGWVESVFARWLSDLPAAERKRRHDALVVATDIYVWKLVRRDMGRSVQHLKTLLLETIGGLIGESFVP